MGLHIEILFCGDSSEMVDKLSECLTRGQLTSYHLNKSSLQNISWSSGTIVK